MSTAHFDNGVSAPTTSSASVTTQACETAASLRDAAALQTDSDARQGVELGVDSWGAGGEAIENPAAADEAGLRRADLQGGALR